MDMNYIHVILHITMQNKAEQDLSVIVKLGALQTHNEVQNFITHVNQQNNKTAPSHVTVHLLRFKI
jgi:hypothetical protein